MISGRGELRVKPETYTEQRTTAITDEQINAKVDAIDGESTTNLEAPVDIGDSQRYAWKDVKEAMRNAGSATSASGANITREELKAELQKILANKVNQQAAVVRDKQRALEAAEAKRPPVPADINTARTALNVEKAKLDQLINQAQASGAMRNAQLRQSMQDSLQLAGRTAPEGSGGGSGQFKAQTVSPQSNMPAPAQAGAGGANLPAPAAMTASPTAGAGYGPNLFNGMNPTTAAYANALALDSNISDGIGMAGKARREGQRLMMLFFFFARMAESGDLGAMYQFIKFITYIIAKDKARQNIQIGSKLIQLQDLSRKATDALLATSTDEKNMGEFMKAQQKAKSEVDTISTSQKLMADMLQEFAHVVESMVNSTKNLLDAWGRVLRTASSR